jgi:hypothetical protein
MMIYGLICPMGATCIGLGGQDEGGETPLRKDVPPKPLFGRKIYAYCVFLSEKFMQIV